MKNKPRIKVCGMTTMQQVEALAAVGADYAGFIFYEKSPRYMGTKILAADLKAFNKIQKVGVFVNEGTEKVSELVGAFGLNAVQLHGDETPGYCKALQAKTSVIKAFRVKGDEDLAEMLRPYQEVTDYFLFDTKAQDYGGTGKKFDWAILAGTAINKPYFLSGGIGADDLEQVETFITGNSVFALDVNSRFEVAPGVKNLGQVQAFVSHFQ